MNSVETPWWIIDLPPEWQAEQEEETVIIYDETGVGEIAITTMEKEQGIVADSELRSFASELFDETKQDSPITVAECEGYYFCYQEEHESLREWYLRYENLLVLITYNCDQSNAGMDDSAVDEILDTLFIKAEEERGND